MAKVPINVRVAQYLETNHSINNPATVKEIHEGTGISIPSIYRAINNGKAVGIEQHTERRKTLSENGINIPVAQYYFSGVRLTEAVTEPSNKEFNVSIEAVAVYPTTIQPGAIRTVAEYNTQLQHVNAQAVSNEYLMQRIAEVVGPRQVDNIKRCCDGLVELIPQLRNNIDAVSAGEAVLSKELETAIFERLELLSTVAAVLMATLQPVVSNEDFTPDRIWRMFDQQVPVQMPATIKEL